MKKIVLQSVTVFALAASASAVSAQSEIDTDGDGLLSYNELLVTYPAMTEENFTAMDTNSDGAIDADEMKVAEEAGMLPSEG